MRSFDDLYKNVVFNHSIKGIGRLQECYDLFLKSANIDGCIIECGVCNGGILAFFAEVLIDLGINKEIFGFDSFCGLLDFSDEDNLETGKTYWPKESFKTDYNSVIRYIEKYKNVTINKGFIPEVTNSFDKKVSFIHIDVDLYKTTYECCEKFYPLLVEKGIMIFDDYHGIIIPGATIAVDRFVKNLGLKDKFFVLPSGQAYLTK